MTRTMDGRRAGRFTCGHKGKGKVCKRCERAKEIGEIVIADEDRAAIARLEAATERVRVTGANLRKVSVVGGDLGQLESEHQSALKELADAEPSTPEALLRFKAVRAALALEAEKAELLQVEP